jgi:hypothetical protein
LPIVLQSLKQECALLGLDAPQAVQVESTGLPQPLIAVVLHLLAPYPDLRMALAEQLEALDAPIPDIGRAPDSGA